MHENTHTEFCPRSAATFRRNLPPQPSAATVPPSTVPPSTCAGLEKLGVDVTSSTSESFVGGLAGRKDAHRTEAIQRFLRGLSTAEAVSALQVRLVEMLYG